MRLALITFHVATVALVVWTAYAIVQPRIDEVRAMNDEMRRTMIEMGISD